MGCVLVLLMIIVGMDVYGVLCCGIYLVDNDVWLIEVEEWCGLLDYVVKYLMVIILGLGIVEIEIYWYYNLGL